MTIERVHKNRGKLLAKIQFSIGLYVACEEIGLQYRKFAVKRSTSGRFSPRASEYQLRSWRVEPQT